MISSSYSLNGLPGGNSAVWTPGFKSNLEIRYQIIVSSIKFRKGFAKFMILIALFKKFLS